MLRIILTFFLFFILIRVISNLFLSSPKGKKSNARIFYNAFKNVRNNQKERRQEQQNENVKNRLDEIEEAEYEDITEEHSESSSQK